MDTQIACRLQAGEQAEDQCQSFQTDMQARNSQPKLHIDNINHQEK